MDRALSAAVREKLGQDVVSSRALSGGDINDAFQATLADGRVVFVKSHPRAPRQMFVTEARGLDWLREASALRVPEVLAASSGEGGGPSFLVLEYIEPTSRSDSFDEILGRGLARLHRSGAPFFGLDYDNFIGSLEQSNGRSADWATFYREQRLERQVRRAVDRGLFDAGLRRDFDELFHGLDSLVGPHEPPSRLHGDLWGGNLHVDDRGEPCLIDPAVYGGHREVDLAMMRLFGGFGPRVFAAYDEACPLSPGAERRVPLYQLYPLLVHVNLFGRSYVGSVSRALRDALAG